MWKRGLLLGLLFTVGLLFADNPAVKVTLKVSPDTIYAGGKGKIVASYVIPQGMHMFKQEDYVYVNPTPVKGFKFGKTTYSKANQDAEGNALYNGRATLTKPFLVDASVAPGKYTVSIAAGFQICSDATGTCLPPDELALTTTIVVHAPEVGVETSAATDSIQVDTLTTAPPDSTNAAGPVTKGPWDMLKYLLMAFLGGIILNIMPCVLPVLSIKAMHLVSQSDQNRRHIAVGGIVYTIGVVMSFMVLATLVAVLKATGEAAGWGFQMQNLGFTIGLSYVMLVFGLSLFDVFIINAPGSNLATQASYKEGHWGSFFSGVFAVLLATPCTAPMLGPALGVAFKLPVPFIFLFFALIALGLALPFLLIGFFPGLIKRLPKPGNWMNAFKEFMGFLLLGTLIYLLNTVYAQLNDRHNFFKVLWFLLFSGWAAWLYGKMAQPQYSKAKQWLGLVLAVLITVGAGFWLLHFPQEKGWQNFTPQLVEQLQQEKKPIFIDFTAQWCMTCKANESGVLETQEVQNEFKKHQVELIRGDFTRRDPVIFEWLQRYHRAGVPLYILYDPKRPDPVVFPEIITKPMVMDELKKLD